MTTNQPAWHCQENGLRKRRPSDCGCVTKGFGPALPVCNLLHVPCKHPPRWQGLERQGGRAGPAPRAGRPESPSAAAGRAHRRDRQAAGWRDEDEGSPETVTAPEGTGAAAGESRTRQRGDCRAWAGRGAARSQSVSPFCVSEELPARVYFSWILIPTVSTAGAERASRALSEGTQPAKSRVRTRPAESGARARATPSG